MRLALFVPFVASCALFEEAPSWRDQLEPDSPCYEVDLLDGVDRSSTAELNGVFACLNHNGHLEPLAPTMRATDRQTRSGQPVAFDLLDALDAASKQDVDLGALLDTATTALRDPDEPLTLALDVAMELMYGVPAEDVRGGVVPLRAPNRFDAAPLRNAAPLANLAGYTLADHPDLLVAVADLLEHEDAPRWVYTIEAILLSDHPDIDVHTRPLMRDFGDALFATGTGTSDDTLRIVSEALLQGTEPALGTLAPDVHGLLSDDAFLEGFEDALLGWSEDGHLLPVASQLGWMATVDRDARPLGPGEISALGAFLRLLHDANRPMRCSVDLFVTDLRFDLGNVALTVLETLADLEPGTVLSLSGFMSDVLDFPLTELLLDEIADSGICPVLTPRLLDDVGAVSVLEHPEADHLVAVLIDLLRVARDEGDGQLERIADVATLLVEVGLLDDVEDLVQQLAPQPLIADILGLAPVLARPARYGLRHPKALPVDLQDFLALVEALVAPRDDGPGRELDRWLPLLQDVVLDDATWQLLAASAPILSDPRTTTSQLPEQLPVLLRLDPDLSLLPAAGALARDPELTAPLLDVLAEGSLVAEIVASRPSGDDPRVPMAWFAELVTDGTLDEVLALVDVALDAMETSDAP